MKRFLVVLSLCSIFIGSTALADPTPAATGSRAAARAGDDPTSVNDCAKARQAGRTCTLDFGQGDTIGGQIATGAGDTGFGLRDVVHTSLIRIRASFRYEIIKSAEDL